MDDDFMNELMGSFLDREQSPEDDFQDMLVKFMHANNHGSNPEARQRQMLEMMPQGRRSAMNQGSTMDRMASGDMYETDSVSGNARQQLLNLLRQLGQR